MGEGIVKRPRTWTFLMSCLEAIPSSHLMSSLYAVTTCGTYPASGTAWRGLSRCQYELLFSLLWWEKKKERKTTFLASEISVLDHLASFASLPMTDRKQREGGVTCLSPEYSTSMKMVLPLSREGLLTSVNPLWKRFDTQAQSVPHQSLHDPKFSQTEGED